VMASHKFFKFQETDAWATAGAKSDICWAFMTIPEEGHNKSIADDPPCTLSFFPAGWPPMVSLLEVIAFLISGFLNVCSAVESL